MTEVPTFSSRTIVWLILVGSISFAGAAFFMVIGASEFQTSHGANSFSYSRIGHHALLDTLRELDIPVVISRANSVRKSGHTAVLVIAEPERRYSGSGTLTQLLTATNVLLVLPKWRGQPDENNPGWVGSTSVVSIREVEWVLQRAVPNGEVRRLGYAPPFPASSVGFDPSLDTVQLINSSRLKPIIANEKGILLGEIFRGTSRVWVLSDPDILSNQGLGEGDNAALVTALVDALRSSGSAVVFDETVHGFAQTPSLWQTMFQLPFLIATIQAIVAIIAFLLAATIRFGSPIPLHRPLAFGKAPLLNNTGSLLQYGGHGPQILRHYRQAVFRDVAHALRMPRLADEKERIDWVDRVGKARQVTDTFQDLSQSTGNTAANTRPGSPRHVQAAQKLYRWKQEILHGP